MLHRQINLEKEKQCLQDFLKWMKTQKICIVEGTHSKENLLYTEQAPDEERGIVSMQKAFSRLDLNFVVIKSTEEHLFKKINESDYVVIYAHGEYGEDGRIQGALDYMDKPYQGPGVLGHAICCNKVSLKSYVSGSSIYTPNFICINKSSSIEDIIEQTGKEVGFPCMLKPLTGGSSIDISYISAPDALSDHLSVMSSEKRSGFFIERFIKGRFITLGAIEMSDEVLCLPPLEVVTESSFYDENIKLHADTNCENPEYRVPANVDTILLNSMQEGLIKLYTDLQCKGPIRADYIIDQEGVSYLLEINTIPGIAENSNFTKAFMSLGFNYNELLIAMMCSGHENALSVAA